jgi:hypothetical protein
VAFRNRRTLFRFRSTTCVRRNTAEKTIESNLALACTHCNRHKGPNIAGVDAASGQIVRLFNPRTDSWREHFEADGPHLRGKTAIGRTTVDVLAMNDADQLRVRSALLKED